jgi:hypothetical protein
MREKKRLPVDAWIQEGLITVTPGNVTDYGFIKRDVAARTEVIASSDPRVLELFGAGTPCGGRHARHAGECHARLRCTRACASRRRGASLPAARVPSARSMASVSASRTRRCGGC